MSRMALGIMGGIAAIGLAAQAAAGTPEEPFVGVPNVNATVGTLGGAQPGSAFGFGKQRFNSFGRSSGSSAGVWVNGGEWARYNNPAFQPGGGYNDWWHDRPDRAYPAWMRNNQNCQRQWYAGNTLRC